MTNYTESDVQELIRLADYTVRNSKGIIVGSLELKDHLRKFLPDPGRTENMTTDTSNADLLTRIETLETEVKELRKGVLGEVIPSMPEDYDIDVRYEGNGISILPGLGRDHPKGIYFALVGKGHISEYREGFGTTRVSAIKAALGTKEGE